jgi:hypothetical protein
MEKEMTIVVPQLWEALCPIIPGGFFRSASIECTHLLKMGGHEHVLWRSFSTLELENLLN